MFRTVIRQIQSFPGSSIQDPTSRFQDPGSSIQDRIDPSKGLCYQRYMDSNPTCFSSTQLTEVNNAVAMAEELVSNHFKMSASQWLRPRFDVKTLQDLESNEVVQGPFAQIIRYVGRHPASSLGSTAYDFYKICLQDHAILATLKERPELSLFPFVLYIVSHELIHIVRFSKFLQHFEATFEEKQAEEVRVHQITHQILSPITFGGIHPVLKFFEEWRRPLDGFEG